MIMMHRYKLSIFAVISDLYFLKLGLDYVFANELEVVAGKVTGEIKGDIIDGPKSVPNVAIAIATDRLMSAESRAHGRPRTECMCS